MTRGLLAAALYLACALWAYRVVLPEPTTTLPLRSTVPEMAGALQRGDQDLVVTTVAHHARTLWERPWALHDTELCYPVPRALAFGEPMIVSGVLAAIPYRLSQSPILAYNGLLILAVMLAGTGMFLLVSRWTNNVAAGLVAGVLFALDPERVVDTAHPFVHGLHWTPFILWSADRWLAQGGGRAFVGLVVSACLQIAESLYAAIAMVLIASVTGPWLLWTHRQHLRSRLPGLLAAVSIAVVFAGSYFAPYLEAREVWSTLQGRSTLLYPPEEFLPGGRRFPGEWAVVLATVGLLDRAWPKRARCADPRLALLAAALLTAWMTALYLPLPWYGPAPSLYHLLRDHVPGLDAIRGITGAASGYLLCVIALAGFGARTIIDRFQGANRFRVAAFLVLLTMVARAFPLQANQSLALSAYTAAPHVLLSSVMQRLPEGAVLDLPALSQAPWATAHEASLSAWHHHPTAACTNAFRPPTADMIVELAASLPSASTITKLRALGFRTIILHQELYPEAMRTPMFLNLLLARKSMPLETRGVFDQHAIFAITGSEPPITRTFDALSASSPAHAVPAAAGTRTTVDLTIRNASPMVYRHPDPVVPAALAVTWWTPEGAMALAERVRAMMPLVLLSGEETKVALPLEVPAASGPYLVRVAVAENDDALLAELPVHVDPSGATAARGPLPHRP